MMLFTDFTGVAGIALGLALLCHRAVGCLLSRRVSMAITGVVFVLLRITFSDLPPAAYVRGMVGDLSITTLVLLGYGFMRQTGFSPKLDVGRRIGGLLLLVLAAAVLYPLALGAAPYDTYRWGYGEPWFLAMLLGFALAAIALRLPLVACSISLAVLAWTVGWYESNNLWDYLIDPMLAIYAVFGLISAIFSRWRSAHNNGR